jgi:glycosyltransferase involved in cell wall biosynthesis
LTTSVLFVGESWQGSSARSLREALALQSGVVIADISEDHFVPTPRDLRLRIANRFLRHFQQGELERTVRQALVELQPNVLVIYKGAAIRPAYIQEVQRLGIPVVNIFPDYSPHAYGRDIKEAMGLYDLVISTKPFHPPMWYTVYGYGNPCVFVPHGYDPTIHLWRHGADAHQYDIALCCAWRPEYHRLMQGFAEELDGAQMSVAIAGSGWQERRREFPQHWEVVGPMTGRAYGLFLRSSKIAIAPVNREVSIRGVKQPGDEDTTRTYELAAAHCFFLHQATDYVRSVYDENTQVPLWKDSRELVGLVHRWLPDDAGRKAMSASAHARAVPAYSIPERAKTILHHIEQVITTRNVLGKQSRD